MRRSAAGALRAAGRRATTVATHLAKLASGGSNEVAEALFAAADATTDARERVDWLRRALAEGAAEPPRVELLHRLETAEVIVRDAAAIEHLREAFDLADEPRQRTRMGTELAEILAHAGQWEQALGTMRLIEFDFDEEMEELRVSLSALLGVATAHDTARVHLFDAERPRLEELARGPSWPAHALRALLASIAIQRGGALDEALRLAKDALGDGILLGEQGAGGWATPQLLTALFLAEEHERARTVCDHIDPAARIAGAPMAHLVASGYRGWSFAREGDLARAEAEFRRALAYERQLALPMVKLTLYYVMSEAFPERPGLADVAEGIETVALEPAFRETWSGAMLLWARALLRLSSRDRDRAIADLFEVGRIATGLGWAPVAATWRSQLALALPADRPDQAVALVEEELALARAAGLPRGVGVALRAAGILAGSSGVALLEEAVDTLAHAPARLELARALVALRRDRRRSQARDQLAAALELAVDCGAVRLAARARDELGATAGRPPRRHAVDPALTPSQLRVARLAAAGMSNRDIAHELYVSLKTVETHLDRATPSSASSAAGRGASWRACWLLTAQPPEHRRGASESGRSRIFGRPR
jgi:DNA-binding CsgD family transcriptional regulator